MGKRTKNLFLDMKKWVRKEVKCRIGTSKINPLPLGGEVTLFEWDDFILCCYYCFFFCNDGAYWESSNGISMKFRI